MTKFKLVHLKARANIRGAFLHRSEQLALIELAVAARRYFGQSTPYARQEVCVTLPYSETINVVDPDAYLAQETLRSALDAFDFEGCE